MITPVDPKRLDTPNRVRISPPPMRKMVVKFVRFPWYSRYQAFDTPMNTMMIPIISVIIFCLLWWMVWFVVFNNNILAVLKSK